MKNIRELTTASSNQPLCSNDKENILLTEEEIREYFKLIEHEKILDQELTNLKIEETEFRSIQETMDLLHKYNEIKSGYARKIERKNVENGCYYAHIYRCYHDRCIRYNNF